ncbi:DNA damage-regulated autophagy modulator protein 2-like [Liolophura sinensis]|uniref:DNA damage-regulated autophagy modulator protein 2-like n=1 Tax=Liolophura sinensis TaxID=3198878 RepID=UPI0031589920
MALCGPGLGFLPVTLVFVACSTIVTSYIIAIYRGHVVPFFPYISDTGSKSPESCIFGQFVNISAALALLVMYVRYKLVFSLVGDESRSIRNLNVISMVLAVFISLGLSMVANFQETNVEPVHITGAGLVFGLGVLYELMQTILSYQMNPGFNGLYICRVRLSISLVSLVAMIITFVAAVISRSKWDKEPHAHDKFHWSPGDDGYPAHITSTMGEWVMCISFLIFYLTYVRDFQKAQLEVSTHLRVQHLDETPVYTDRADERTRLLI